MKKFFQIWLLAALLSCEEKDLQEASPIVISAKGDLELVRILDFIKEGNLLLKQRGLTDYSLILASNLTQRFAGDEVVLGVVQSNPNNSEQRVSAEEVLIVFQEDEFPGLKLRFTTLVEE